MFKKLTLALLIGSVVAQPVIASSIDTVALKACSGAFNGVKSFDVDAFIKCINDCKAANSNQFTRAIDWVSNNSAIAGGIGLLIGGVAFYTLIWPDIAIRISYQKNSRAEMQAGRRP